uniref:Uncharacterized protein n=1 Tax=Pyxicephalus adspersus TaxID=30357 RepID=A0AAV3B422_PYXAD|nr:TPA: hypothetical protein GDO54_005968 [Pyxicephalus adspersus]
MCLKCYIKEIYIRDYIYMYTCTCTILNIQPSKNFIGTIYINHFCEITHIYIVIFIEFIMVHNGQSKSNFILFPMIKAGFFGWLM